MMAGDWAAVRAEPDGPHGDSYERCCECGERAARRDDAGRLLCIAHFRLWAAARFAAVHRVCAEIGRARRRGVRLARDKYGRSRRIEPTRRP